MCTLQLYHGWKQRNARANSYVWGELQSRYATYRGRSRSRCVCVDGSGAGVVDCDAVVSSSTSSYIYLRPNLLHKRKFVIVLLGLLLLPWRSDRPATA